MGDVPHSARDAPTPTLGDTDLSAAATIELGSLISRYVVLERIGAGGMGVVYAAYDPELDRKVAIKLLQLDVADDASSLGRARLLREAQALARLTHPNVVAVHDVGTWTHQVFVAMEFVHGMTLGKWMREGKRTQAEIVAVFGQAGAGLRAAHDAGLMHRDFKPDNVMIGSDGRVRVLDFGLARSAGAVPLELEPSGPISLERSDHRSERNSRVDSRITRTGAMAGTPAYMAPEQHRGDDLDPRADQFSFCVALWEALCGQRPFTGADRIGLALAVCSGKRRPIPEKVTIPTRWRKALERGLQPDPAARFPDMAALLAEFAPQRSRAPALMVGGAALTAVAALLAAQPGPPADTCAGAGARIDEAWGPARNVAIAQRFASVHPSLGPATAERVKATLDTYARGWVDASRDACEATHERREQSDAMLDRRVACLGERLVAMKILVDGFVAADAEMVPHAVDAATALPELERCADTEALGAAVPPPEDRRTAAEVDRIRKAIAAAEVEGHLGRYAQTYAAIGDVLERAGRTSHRPIVAEAELLAGELATAAGEDDDAVRHLRAATLAAIAAGHDQAHLRATTKLASVVGIGQSRYADGLAWASQAAAVLERVGPGGRDHAYLSEVMCKLLADKGDVALALAHCLRALELSVSLWGEDDPRTARAHEALGITHFVAGRAAEAEQQFRLVEAMVRRTKGEDHPDLAQLANGLAATCFYQHGAARCVEAFEAAVAAAERAFGPDHDTVADVSNNLAIVLVDLGRLDEAELRARRSLEIRRARPTEHPGTAAALHSIGRIEAARGHAEAAFAALDEAIAIYRRTRGTRHPDVAATLRTAATERAKHGDVAIARAQLTEALSISEALDRPVTERDELRALLDALPAR